MNAEVLRAALTLYEAAEKPVFKEFIKQMHRAEPGYEEAEYEKAWIMVSALHEHACHLAFRWANENPPGAVIDSRVIDSIFLEEIQTTCPGFTTDEYSRALGYGFERGIF